MREIKVEFETSSRPQKYNRLPRVIAKEDRDLPMPKKIKQLIQRYLISYNPS